MTREDRMKFLTNLTPEEKQRLLDERDAKMAGEDPPPPSPKAVPYDDLMEAFKIVE